MRANRAMLLTVAVLAASALTASVAHAQVSARLLYTETELWDLSVRGDEGPNRIALACASNQVLLNGQVALDERGHPLPCGGPLPSPQLIEVDGEGGDDTIDTTQVTPQAGFTSVAVGGEGHHPLVKLDGGAGHDTLIGGPMAEELNTAADARSPDGDVLRGNGGGDAIYGTEGNDTIYGGPGADVIYPLEGSDVVYAGPGDDSIADEGFDRGGHDRFYGEGGRDSIFGGAGPDVIDGGAGNDFLQGMGGNDRLVGGPGNDYLSGEAGNDTLIGGPGHDTLSGGAGHNRVTQ